jgi:hypothetical protein
MFLKFPMHFPNMDLIAPHFVSYPLPLSSTLVTYVTNPKDEIKT